MTTTTVQQASLWRESWAAIKMSMPKLWPWVVGAGLLDALINFLISAQTSAAMAKLMAGGDMQNPQFLQQHPDAFVEMSHEISRIWLISIVPIALFFTIATYVMTVKFLQLAMKRNRPELSVNGLLYWFGRMFFAWLRNFWLLLPVVGWFFLWPRALLRYRLVSPLAVLRRGDELQTSWNLTENNWWRLFGNLLLFVIIVLGLPVLLSIAVNMGYMMVFAAKQVATHTDPGVMMRQGQGAMMDASSPFSILHFLIQGLIGGLSIMVSAIFSCTCYRVLSQEAPQKAPLPASQTTASP